MLLTDPRHRSDLDAEFRRLISFGRHVVHPDGGAAWLGDDGSAWLDRGRHTYRTARISHVFGLAHLVGIDGAAAVSDAMIDALLPGSDGWPVSDANPEHWAYDHAFVVLAGSTATVAGRPGGPPLLEAGLAGLERFWEPGPAMYADRYDATWSTLDPYRGVNANMHAVEALLAASDATGNPSWRERALVIAERAVRDGQRDWRLPEHYAADWTALPEHHRDRPDDPFQPYGATVGHGLEWSRLLLHLEAGLGDAAPGWLRPAAAGLFDRAVADGWAPDGADGFVYTTGWDGKPIVRQRMYWVVAEGLAAAAVLHQVTGDASYAERYATFWEYLQENVIDREHGSWHHELDAQLRPASTVWAGKPDLYHATQAMLVPLLPVAPTAALAIREGRV